jgi:hypothetical protein
LWSVFVPKRRIPEDFEAKSLDAGVKSLDVKVESEDFGAKSKDVKVKSKDSGLKSLDVRVKSKRFEVFSCKDLIKRGEFNP